MKKEDIDHLPCLLMLVSSPPTSISTEVKCTTGAPVVTPKCLHGAMVNASGYSQETDQLPSMFQSQATTNSATVNFHQTHLSVMALINTCLSGSTNITGVSGVCGELSLSGDASATGCSLSTSER